VRLTDGPERRIRSERVGPETNSFSSSLIEVRTRRARPFNGLPESDAI